MKEAIGWALFHFLWEGAAIALLLAAVLVICRSSRTRYAAACVALLAMLAAFGVTLALNLPESSASMVAVHVPAGTLPARPPAGGGVPLNAPAMPYEWAVPIWLAGVALLSLHRLAGFLGTWRLRRIGLTAVPEHWQARMAAITVRLGIRRTVRLFESCLAEVPLTAGYLRPAILLPLGLLAGLPSEQVEYILIHELAHIARRDYLVNLVQSMVEALLFYHPAVWWVSGVIRAEREHCCDDAVVAMAGDAPGYAAALVTLEHARALEPALAATGGSLTRRVRRLLRQPAPQSLAAPLAAAATAIALMAMVLSAAGPQQIAAPAMHPPAPVLMAQTPAHPDIEQKSGARKVSNVPDPYHKWLTEDVAYIITNEERAAFKALQTNPEREQFIEQFWLRRDPTPGTVYNEFKEEHYRRIAYANEHFSSSDLSGWKTDRGRVYITWGPPDEIEDHAAATATTAPYQQWRYRYIEGIGNNVIIEFVDSQRNGDFSMTSDPTVKFDAAKQPNEFQRIEQIARINKPPAAVTQGQPNVYVANEPGGKSTVTVTGRQATITVPSTSADMQTVAVRVTTGGRAISNSEFQVIVDPGRTATWTYPLTLEPGNYLLNVTFKNQKTGETRQESVHFFVY